MLRNFGREEENWQAIQATVCYQLWQWRNLRNYADEHIDLNNVTEVIRNRVKSYSVSMSMHHRLRQTGMNNSVENWNKLEHGWICLNMNGAVSKNKVVGCGCITWNSNKDWICDLAKNIGYCNVFNVELWGVFEGIKLVQAKVFFKVELQTDSQVAVHALQDNASGNQGSHLIRKIKFYMEGITKIKVVKVHRSINRCIDSLAKYSLSL